MSDRETSKIDQTDNINIVAQPSLALEAKFRDMGSYGEAVGWDLDFRQLDRGGLEAGIRAIAGGLGVVLQVDFNRSFHQVGCAPGEFLTFGIPDIKTDEFEWCASRAKGGVMLNFNLESGFEGVSPAGFRGHTFSFGKEALQAFAESLGFRQSLDSLSSSSSFWHSPATIELGGRLRLLSQRLDQSGPGALTAQTEFLNENIAVGVLEILDAGQEREKAVAGEQKNTVLKRSMKILDDPNRLPITVTRLCAEVGTSPSTLKRVFLAEFDMPPKAYIRARCLSAVRDQLALSPPGTRIADVANRWGFWHMGQFARDYRAMFGALPSQHRGLGRVSS